MAANEPILPSVARMAPGDHYCGIYRTDEDQRAFIIDYIREGARKNDKMFYIVNVQTAAQLKQTLASAGIDVDGLVEKGQLVIATAQEAYLREGVFDPDKMIKLLGDETEKALAEGYNALRATGEMTWALAGDPGSEKLVEYESRLNNFFPHARCYAVCQYDRRKFDADMLLDILHTHPKVLFGREGYDNSKMYFVPDDAFSSGDRQGAVLDTRLKNLESRGPVPA
jgi:hypothetical protein